MAATSPYSQNDYQAVSNFRPYELPVNDIFKAFSAQNQFWNAGAERVKAYYDNALNLKLSLEPNKEIRKKYMEDAEKQLTKLSSMDLADPTVQRQGFALFKPLFQDEGIIYDDLTTRHYEKVRNDALMYRSKDNGKGYSDINFQYAMNGYNEFLNSQDRMAGKDFYQNRKEYTPYYDYTDDFSQSLKDCKASSIETISPVYNKGEMSGYMQESYGKSLSASQVQNCLESGLSPNAKRQLQIEGSVSYRNNLPTLASDAATYLSGVSGNYSTQLQVLSAQKAAILGKKDMSDAEKAEAIAIIDQQSTTLGNELDRTNNTVKKLNAGDFTDVQNNFENYASSVYSYKKLYKKAMASAFEERKSNYKADPVQLNAIRFKQQEYLNRMDFDFSVSLKQMEHDHDRDMKLLDLMYGGKGNSGGSTGGDISRNPFTGEITINPDLLRETANLTDKPELNKKVYEELNAQVGSLTEKDNNNNLRIYNNLVSRGERDKAFRETLLKGFNYGVTDDEWTRFKAESRNNRFSNISGDPKKIGGIQDTSWFRAYIGQNPDDEDINKWAYDNTIIESGISTINRKLEIAESQVQKELGGDYESLVSKEISSIKPVTINGRNITSQNMRNLMSGKNENGLSITRSTSVEGKPLIMVNIDGIPSPQATQLYQQTETVVKPVSSKLNKKRIEVYSKLGFDREPWYFTPSDDKNPPDIVKTIKSILPKDKEGKDLDVSIISSDFSGGIRVSVPGAKQGSDKFLTELRNAGIGTSAEATGDNIITIRGTNHNLIQQALQNPILADAAYQLNTISETTSFAQTQPGAKVPNSDIKVPVLIRGKQQIMTIETYRNDSKPEFRVYVEGANTSKPIITASNPYELFEKIGRSPLDLNKPIR